MSKNADFVKSLFNTDSMFAMATDSTQGPAQSAVQVVNTEVDLRQNKASTQELQAEEEEQELNKMKKGKSKDSDTKAAAGSTCARCLLTGHSMCSTHLRAFLCFQSILLWYISAASLSVIGLVCWCTVHSKGCSSTPASCRSLYSLKLS